MFPRVTRRMKSLEIWNEKRVGNEEGGGGGGNFIIRTCVE